MKGLVKFITDDQKHLHEFWVDDGLGLTFVYSWSFQEFYLILKGFINIREYANEIIYISDHRKKGMCLSFKVVPYFMLYDK